jgi:glycosyltransferase involved in cell wall biosynthesis
LRALTRVAVERDAGILVRDHYTTEILVSGMRKVDQERIAAEIHNLPERGLPRRRIVQALQQLNAIVTISDGLRDDLIAEGIDPRSILVARDGVHLSRFRNQPSPSTARMHLGVPVDMPAIVYAGQLYRWKGVDTLIEAMQHLPDAQLLVVGGDHANLPRIESLVQKHAPGRVRLTGTVPHHAVPFYLAAADVLVLPNSGEQTISRRYTSPLKLFEALAAGRPIVASDIPSLREVLEPDRNALLVKPDDPGALAEGLRTLLDDPQLGMRLAENAEEDAKPYDWSERGRKVAHFLRDRLTVGSH